MTLELHACWCGTPLWPVSGTCPTCQRNRSQPEYHGVTCSHPHNTPYNDECAVWWLRGTPQWRLAHTNLPNA